MLEKSLSADTNIRILRRYILGLCLFWTLTLAALALFNYYDSLHYAKLNVIAQARDTFNKDLVLRRWVAGHGGVYVPVNGQTPPNPYLKHLSRRDIVTRDGQKLTLMNPAYVMRQVYDADRRQFGQRGHITSLNLLRPENQADKWETRALKRLAAGAEEVVDESTIDGQLYLRLMRPLYIEKGCLKCHDFQGYKIGDLRGGTSVSLPMAPVLSNHQLHMAKIFRLYLLLWLAGLLLFYGIYRRNRKRIYQNAEKNLRLRKLSIMVEQTHSAIMIIETDGRIEFTNHGYERLSGYTTTEMTGQDPRQLFATEKLAKAREDLWQTIKQGRRWRGVIASRHKNGHIIYEDAAAFPIIDDDGNIINYAVIKHDVSDAHKLQEQLLQAQKMEAVGTLASGVAHDFNNILTVINSFSEILIDECEPESPIRSDLVEINQAGLRAADLTRQLLAFSRQQIVEPRKISLHKLITGLMKMMRRLLSEDIDLEFDLDETETKIEVMADPGQIEQVLINLLVNARDALKNLDKDKKIKLSLSVITVDGDFVKRHPGSRSGNFALIEIADNGSGMNQETRQRCFEPFFTTKELGHGTGLGLSMIYGIVKQNDGYLLLASEPGQGTTISIYWPLLSETELNRDET